ncbi:MAG: N-acetyl-gamma-glutamyl-phosphate reductase [Hyphomicrobiales bacterium]|nr:N-acetyl-gamma-glutamyl-phosphate reductase [Hyphomicrobiales bacterium]
MTAKVFIDGEAGTTGLQIAARLAGRRDIELLRLDDAARKDTDRRREMLNMADLAILCLPDDAAREAVDLIESPQTGVIDASTAHRVSDGWVYGFPEYDQGQRALIASAKRVANPGCYAISSVAMLHPLIEAGLIAPDWPVTINAISGYSGGGKSMIAEFENAGAPGGAEAPFFTYGHALAHKHVPEITRWGGLVHPPLFMPSVGRFAQGMIVQLPLPLWAMPGAPAARDIHAALADHYAGQRFVTVAALEETKDLARLAPEALNGTNELRLHVFRNEGGDQAVVMGLLDNLGKGASGQAVQNLNIMLGLAEETGLA